MKNKLDEKEKEINDQFAKHANEYTAKMETLADEISTLNVAVIVMVTKWPQKSYFFEGRMNF